ncbi:MAG: hypothetical protein JNL70_01150 [Saprospiraceae bacterium]|nr:hypothetical protein [Saprospiraceae bacterium]
MKIWKKISVFLLCLFWAVSSLSAQKTVEAALQDMQKGNYGTPEQRAAELDKSMQKGLQLTKDQMTKVSAINLRYARRNEVEVVQQKMNDWSKYRKIMAIQSEKDAELRSVLTSEQFQKYQKKRDDAMWQAVKSWFW